MAEARIKLSISEGTFEIEGSETFVSKQLEAFGDVIKKALSEAKAKSKPKEKPDPGTDATILINDGDYSGVFEIHEGSIKVLSDIPGEDNKEKTVNAGLLAAFARGTEGTDTVGFDEVREICKLHSCLDVKNFSTYLKKEKKAFLFGGTPRSKKQTLKLTMPGKKQAEELVKELSG